MNGISSMISKSCCPIYNFGTNNKKDLIPSRLSNLHLQIISPLVASTRMLKHGAYSLSSLKDVNVMGFRSEVPEVSGGIEGTFESSLRSYMFLLVMVVGPYVGDILYGFAVVLLYKPFSIGDIIQVGSVKGQVIKVGLLTTTLTTADNVPIRVSNSLFCSKAILNISRAGWCTMESKFFVQVDEIEKIHKISEAIINMMKSNSSVYLDKEQPYCCLSGFQRYCVELTLGCNLKKMSEDKLRLAKQEVLMELAQIIKKHRASIIKCTGK